MSHPPDPPGAEELRSVLADAGSVHHDYESVFLKGERDPQWPGFYAAFVLGRLGGFTSPSTLTEWLQDAPAGEDWAKSASRYVVERL